MALLLHGNGCKRPWQLSLLMNVCFPAGVVLCSSQTQSCFSDSAQFCINSSDFFLLCLLSSLFGWVGFFPRWFPTAVGALLFLRIGGGGAKKEASVGEFENRLSCNCASPPPMTSAEWGISWDPEKGPVTQSPQERSRSRVKSEVFGERFEGEWHGDTSQWMSERWGRGPPDTRHPLPGASSISYPWLRRKDEFSVWNVWVRRWRMGQHWWGRREGYPALILDGLITGNKPGHARHCCHAVTTSSTTVWVTNFEGWHPNRFMPEKLL